MTSKNSEVARVEHVLDAFSDDLWLVRRYKLDQVVGTLESLSVSKDSSQPLQILIRDWIRFLQFLESECSGELFADDDKQWGQLMNLMQISRKLNHKSVKFRDILKNRHLIEANVREIKQFNEQARLKRSIEKLIETFELDVNRMHLLLSSSQIAATATSRRTVDWQQELIVELSKCQRTLDNTLKATVNNLQVNLNKELVRKQNWSLLESWSKKLTLFTRMAEKLCNFVENYLALERELAHLRPLVESLEGKVGVGDGQQRALGQLASGRRHNDQLENSLTVCKANFEKVLAFEQKLETQLKATNSGPIRRKSSSISGSISIGNNQQVEIRLIKLLKPLNSTKQDEFVSELFGSQLLEALIRAKECRQTLDGTMASLRLEFGRFYFVNDLEMLTIISLDWRLAKDSNRTENKRLICKLFSNSIERFLLSDELDCDAASKSTKSNGPLQIVGIQTPIGERIFLTTCGQEPIQLQKRINIYSLEIVRIFNELLRKLQRSLVWTLEKSLDKKSVDFDDSDLDWSLPVQLFELAERIKFTRQVEFALANGIPLEKLLARHEKRLKSLSGGGSGLESSGGGGELKRSAAISLTVHFISILLNLIKRRVNSKQDWHWLKLARYYLLNSKIKSAAEKQQQLDSITSLNLIDPNLQLVEVHLADSKFFYKFDLLPVESSTNLHQTSKTTTFIKRLIYTDTSERCFLVASQAVGRLKLGANPFGPAGSGKTETVKALGQLLGCQVIVHNCDETNELRALERLIWGLAHTGFWGCFDEFNRLSSSTLSSVSGLLELVQTSLRSASTSSSTTLELADGQMKSIDPNSAFFVTMNPSEQSAPSPGRNYRGRRRLPANLRSLFLPIAMVRTQIDCIVRELLLMFGASVQVELMSANLAERIGSQMANWVEWSRANLQIDRCEWDLRLVMTILKRLVNSFGGAKLAQETNLDEQVVLELFIRCIVKEVGPRLFDDGDEFQLLATGLNEAFKVALKSQEFDEILGDCLQQLEEQLETRPGVILLSGSLDKTPDRDQRRHLWRALADKKNSHNTTVGWFQLNPKSCRKCDLLGHFEENSPTKDGAAAASRWRDGLLAKLARKSLDLLQYDQNLQQIWFILNGPIDPDWIESLNSVLDDNQVLTLSSGERINFTVQNQAEQARKCIKLIFETDNLKDASPATISRLGLINVNKWWNRAHGDEVDPERQLVELVIVEMDPEVLLKQHQSNRPARDCLLRKVSIDERKLNETAMSVLEFACFEGATSRDLIELLDRVAAATQTDSSCLLLVHNLHLIQTEDQWRTRTFVELLLHVVATGNYYDREHDLQPISTKLQIFVTTSGVDQGQDYERLLALASRRVKFTESDLGTSEFDQLGRAKWSIGHLVSWCLSGTAANSEVEEQPTALLIMKVDHQITAQTLLHQLKDKIHDESLGKSDEQVDIMSFESSQNALKSLESLTKLTEQLVQTSAGQKPNGHRSLLLVDSLQMRLMEPEQRAQLGRTLNRIKLKGLQLEALNLRCLFVHNALAPSQLGNKIDHDHEFWLQLAANNQATGSIREFDWLKLSESDDEIRATLIENLNCHQVSSPAQSGFDLNWLVQVLKHFYSANRIDLERHSFLACLIKMLLALRRHVESQQSLLANGLERLAQFETTVESWRQLGRVEELALAERQREIELLLERINQVIKTSQTRSEQLAELRQRQTLKRSELDKQRDELELKLANVMPLVELSKREIDVSLKPEALNEIKSLRAPPKTIKDILEVLFMVLLPANGPNEGGLRDWSEMKSYLTKFSLRDELTVKFDFRRRLADERLIARLDQEISARQQSFQLDQAARASSAIVPVVKWLQAVREYGRALIRVGPLAESMLELEQEAAEMTETMNQLELEQSQLAEKIRADREQLTKLEASYDQARRQLDEAKSQVERAESIRTNLAKPFERWQFELKRYEKLLHKDNRELYWLCLVAADLTLVAPGDLFSFSERILFWLELAQKVGSEIKTNDVIWQQTNTLQAAHLFLANCFSLLLESVASGQSHSSEGVQTGLELELALKTAPTRDSNSKQLDHLIRLLIVELNLHFNSRQLLLVQLEPTLSFDALTQYLSHKQIICSSGREELVLIRQAADWRSSCRKALEVETSQILLIDLMNLEDSNELLLDVFDFFLSWTQFESGRNRARGRVILFSRDANGHIEPRARQLLRELHLNSKLSSSLSGDNNSSEVTRVQLEMDICDQLLELCEPQLAETINQLELELRSQRAEVKRLEMDLIRKLMVAGGGGGSSSSSLQSAGKLSTLSSENELVSLLLELSQSNESLARGIEQVSFKLAALQERRQKFQPTSREMSKFYANFLADDEFDSKSNFYHLSRRQFVRLFVELNRINSKPLAAIVEHVMSSMRPNDRQWLFERLCRCEPDGKSTLETLVGDEATLRLASQRAANLKQSLLKLMKQTNKDSVEQASREAAEPSRQRQLSFQSFKFAIILHDARKSSPQMEVDELFMRQQNEIIETTAAVECQYFKLYASTTTTTTGRNQLESQLEAILSRQKSPLTRTVAGGGDDDSTGEVATGGGCVKCICIANAHLAAHWINSRLLDVVASQLGRASTSPGEGSKLEQFVILLVAESDESGKQNSTSSEFDPNLLDEAQLRFWYDELGLELADRYQLNKHLIESTHRVTGDNKDQLISQLVLFHVVCQELTKGSNSVGWQMGQNYTFDYELLSLALKVMRQLGRGTNCRRRDETKIDRVAFCHQLESIVYGARMESSRDEKLLTHLIDKFLRISELANSKLVQFEKLFESTRTKSKAPTTTTLDNDLEQRREFQSQLLEQLLAGT